MAYTNVRIHTTTYIHVRQPPSRYTRIYFYRTQIPGSTGKRFTAAVRHALAEFAALTGAGARARVFFSGC